MGKDKAMAGTEGSDLVVIYTVGLINTQLRWRVNAETRNQAISMVCKIVNDNPAFESRLLMTDLEIVKCRPVD